MPDIEEGTPARRPRGVRIIKRIITMVVALLVGTYLLLAVVTVAFGGWINHSVVIDAPVEAVWDYGSDSTRAREWSVFFHHIDPIEGRGKPRDGTLGAYRVCYRFANERGMRWDETTEAITKHEHRKIRTFNLVGFPMGPVGTAQEYEVHQDYEALDDVRTRLTFRSKLTRRTGVGNLLAWPVVKGVYVIFGQPAGQEVFVWNLENIRAAVEAKELGTKYHRPHPYSRRLPWEAKPFRWWVRNRWDSLTD